MNKVFRETQPGDTSRAPARIPGDCCTGECRQGRDCPRRARRDLPPGSGIALAVILVIAIAIGVSVVYGLTNRLAETVEVLP